MPGDGRGAEVTQHHATFRQHDLFRATNDLQRLRIHLGDEHRSTMAGNVIVVGRAPRVRQQQPFAVRQPVCLSVVAAQIRSVVEFPGPRLVKLEPVVARGDISRVVIPQSQVVLPLEVREGGFSESAAVYMASPTNRFLNRPNVWQVETDVNSDEGLTAAKRSGRKPRLVRAGTDVPTPAVAVPAVLKGAVVRALGWG
jgi:hypothetical protein